jgi:hypothetical protein
MQSALEAGLSLSQFRALRLQFVQQVGVYKAEASNNDEVIKLLEQAAKAYTDAEQFWIVNLRYGSGERGMFDPDDMKDFGMGAFVEKYRIPIIPINRSMSITRRESLSAIWVYAKERTERAFSLAQ